MPVQELEYVTISSQIFDYLRRQFIVSDEFKDGVFIRESEMAKRFGVSRAPVREALKQLEMMGLVVSIPRRGMQVRMFSREELDELYEVRTILEESIFRKIVEEKLFTPAERRRFEGIIGELIGICESDRSREERILAFCDKDLEFHTSLAKLSGRVWTTKFLESLYCQLHLALLRELKEAEVLTDLAKLHPLIIDYLSDGDLESLTKDRRYSYFDRRNKTLSRKGGDVGNKS